MQTIRNKLKTVGREFLLNVVQALAVPVYFLWFV